MRVLSVAMWLCVAGAQVTPSQAQHALAAASVDAVDASLPSPMVTLRPEHGLEELARRVAAILELRTGQRVVVGDAPPPGLLEAVPTGHVAFAKVGDSVQLVLGAVGGRSLDTHVALGSDSVDASARAVALALESLRDEAQDLLREPDRRDFAAQEGLADQDLVVKQARVREAPRDGDDPALAVAGESFLGSVQPLAYVRAYGGVSSASASLMTGLGTGLGLCVEGYCLVVTGDMPANSGSTESLDVRYRYPTFTSGFYARPLTFGALTPGASVGFLTRLGHFNRDMGLPDSGLETDLGARGTLELAWEVVPGLDVMSEGGVDFTIDRHTLSEGFTVRSRGDRWSPWAQTALRYRP